MDDGDAVMAEDPSFDAWLRKSSDYSKKDKESLDAYAAMIASNATARKKAWALMVTWPGVLTPRIIDLCETESSAVAQMDGSSLFTELMRPAHFGSARHQDAILADLAKVHQYANAPESSASPLPDKPTHEDVQSFLEAYWLVWRKSNENDVDKPSSFIITSFKVIRPITEMRTYIDMQLALYLKGDRTLTGRAFIDEIAIETRSALPSTRAHAGG